VAKRGGHNSPFQVGLGKPFEPHFYQPQGKALIPSLEGWIEVEWKGYVEATFVLGMGETPREVRHPNLNRAARCGDSVQFAHHPKRVFKVFQEMIRFDHQELVVFERIRKLVQIVANIGL